MKKAKKPARFELAVKKDSGDIQIYVECSHSATMDTQLHTRHGSCLTLRNLKWYVAAKEVAHQLLSAPVLEALGLQTTEALVAACDRYDGDVDMRRILPELCIKGGPIARLLNSEGKFHSTGLMEDRQKENDVILLELGSDTAEEISEALEHTVISGQRKWT